MASEINDKKIYYPSAVIKLCKDEHNPREAPKERLCFRENGIDERMYRIYVKQTIPLSPGFWPFLIKLRGHLKTVWLFENDLMHRFSLSKEEIQIASKEKDLMRLIEPHKYWILPPKKAAELMGVSFAADSYFIPKEKIFEEYGISERLLRWVTISEEFETIPKNCTMLKTANAFETLMKAAQTRPLYFSRKDYPITHTLYVSSKEIYSAIPGNICGQGLTSRVKTARTLKGNLVARKICDSHSPLFETALKSLSNLKALQKVPQVIRILDDFIIQTPNGKQKLIVILPLYPSDLFAYFSDPDMAIPKQTQYKFALQLLEGLEKLEGTHGDLKPENILIEGEKLVLIDFDFYQKKEERAVQKSGSLVWAPPEGLKSSLADRDKYDVWPAGMILCYLFLELPRNKFLPWQMNKGPNLTACNYSQKDVDLYLAQAKMTEPERELIQKMIVYDPKDRYTISHAAEHFRKKIYHSESS